MPKNVMQDVIPKEKRSIRNVELPGNKRKKRNDPLPPPPDTVDMETESDPVKPRRVSQPRNRENGRKKFFVLGTLIILVVLIAILMTVFGKTNVIITPKTAEANVNTAIIAVSETTASSSVLFQTINLEDTLTKQVPATDEKYVETQAFGTITVYNNFDDKDQRLITNTRFESDGKIYRIRESIVVPGKQGSTPGSVEVVVYADSPGPEYNISNAEFTIPGFKGDPRYDKFYAKTKSSIGGGFKGEKKQIAEGIYNDARNELDTSLRANLIGAIQAQVPKDLVMISGLVDITYEDIPEKDNGDSVTIGRRAKVTVPLLQNSALASFIANMSGVGNELPLTIENFDTITVSYTDNDMSDGSISFTVSGPVKFVAQIDENKVKEALAGKSKSEMVSILSNIPEIASAEASISPFWIRSFPTDKDSINTIIK